MKTIGEIQKEVKEWALTNFGERESWQPLLGINEELGELSYIILYDTLFINNRQLEIIDCIGDMFIFMCDYCSVEDINLEKILSKIDFTYNIHPTEEIVLLYMSKDIGKLNHSHLKLHQGIRINEYHQLNKEKALSRLFIHMTEFCELNGIHIYTAIDDTWNKVSKRDWNVNNINGKTNK